MMKRNLLTIWAKRTIPALALMGTTLNSCDKEPVEQKPIYRAPYEKELRFNDYTWDSIQPQIITKFVRDTACKHIYLTVMDNNNFTHYGNADMITNLRNYLDQCIHLAPNKISGRGEFWFLPEKITIADSLWFVQNGWTIRVNQR